MKLFARIVPVCAVFGVAAFAFAQVSRSEPSGKITPWEAMKAANVSIKGTPVSATFEFEGGKWFYAVLLTKNKKLYEVEVNATTGKAGASETVSVAEETKEFQQDLSAAIGK